MQRHVNVSPKGLMGTFQFISTEAAMVAGGKQFNPETALVSKIYI